MRAFLAAAAVLAVVSAAANVGFTQAKPSATASIQGVWKITELVRTGANAANVSAPQPSLYIFTPRHYSIMSVNGTQTRSMVADSSRACTAAVRVRFPSPFARGIG